jgi:hypothetical protein
MHEMHFIVTYKHCMTNTTIAQTIYGTWMRQVFKHADHWELGFWLKEGQA